MWNPRYFAIVVLLSGLWRPALAAESTTATSQPADPIEKVLPEVKFDGVPLIDALNYLQSQSPGFSLARQAGDGAVESSPVNMRMKNVTVRQVLFIMRMEFPSITFTQLGPSGRDPFVVVVGPTEQPKPEPTILQIFRLGPAIKEMAATNGGQTKTKPLDDILSLIQAALSQVPSQTPPTVQVHEATQTLIFKGNREQLEAVQQVMSAVEPTKQEQEDAKVASTKDALEQQYKARMDEQDFIQALKEKRIKELGTPPQVPPAIDPNTGIPVDNKPSRP